MSNWLVWGLAGAALLVAVALLNVLAKRRGKPLPDNRDQQYEEMGGW